MSGGGKYSASTFVGNWYEEVTLKEAKVADFKKRSDAGSLNLRQLEAKIQKCTQTVPHSGNTDGMLRFGDSLMLFNAFTENFLMCDPYEDQDIGRSRFLVSTAKANGPTARSVFTIVRPTANQMNLGDDPDDDVLRYGAAFMLKCDDALLSDAQSTMLSPALYLSSIKKTEITSTKETNRQMVFMSPNCGSDAVWAISKPSFGRIGATERYLSEGSPVLLSDVYLLVHRQTNCCITTDPKKSERTMFGVEYECYADRSSAHGKIGLISSEFKGECTSKTLSKPDSSVYYWQFVASDEGVAEDRNLPPPVSRELLVEQMRNFAAGRGAEGWLGLRAQLAFTDSKSGIADGKIDSEDIKDCISRWGVGLGEVYLDEIIDQFGGGEDILSYREFLSSLRGPISNGRREILEKLFSEMAGTDAVVPMEVFTKFLNPESHPLAYFGGYSAADVQSHIVDAFNAKGVTMDAFVDYFSDIAVVADDEYFEGTVRNVLQL